MLPPAGSAESEPLVEDGLRLWLAVLRSSSAISPQLQVGGLLWKVPGVVREVGVVLSSTICLIYRQIRTTWDARGVGP